MQHREAKAGGSRVFEDRVLSKAVERESAGVEKVRKGLKDCIFP